MKKLFWKVLGAVGIVCLFILPSAAEKGVGMPVAQVTEVSLEEIERQREFVTQYNEEEAKIKEQYLVSEEDIQYYAYLDIDTADEELKPIILAARNMIIHRYSWVAEGMNGKILGKDGNIKEDVPEFSEIFPESWEMPVAMAKDVDLSYYAAPSERKEG